MDLSDFKTNRKLEEEGTWVEVGNGTQLKLARLGNSAYRNHLKILMKPYKAMIRNNTLSDEVVEELLNKAIAKSVLLDWSGLEENGEPVPYSEERAYQILSDPSYKDFRELVVSLASDMEVYQQEELEESAKN